MMIQKNEIISIEERDYGEAFEEEVIITTDNDTEACEEITEKKRLKDLMVNVEMEMTTLKK